MSTALDDSGSAIKIRARDVRMDFAIADERGRKQQIAALQDFNLDIREGEFFTLLGPSGCGKSTFLNVLAGLARKTGGSISIDGQPASGINREQGVVFQGYALFPWRTVLQNIEVGLEIRKIPKRERRETAEQFLHLVGLAGFGQRYPHELGRDASARGHRPLPGLFAQPAADGRAVCRPGCPDTRNPAVRAAAHLGAAQDHHRLHHPQPR